MELALLAGVIVFLLVMYWFGYSKGLIRIVLSFAITIVSFVLAILLAGPFESFVKNSTPVYDKINNQMTEYISKYVSKEFDAASEELQKEAIKELKLPSTIQNKLIDDNTIDEKLLMGAESFSEYLAMSLTDMLVEAFSVIILFILIKLILRIIVSIIDLISKLQLIDGVNKSLGGLVGLAEGILIIWVVCILLTAMSGTAIGQQIFEAISTNKILNFIYNNNLLLKFLSSL
ncbi:MAG: CvpA family protein [Lachnospiraceae bacterium]|nr:CvpA family protein [Lachnospiraceae bacterium]